MKLKLKAKLNAGFTLLEILLVVAAIAILAGIVIFAINPAKQLGDTRNAQRRTDVNTILSAVQQYRIDNNGALPGDITSNSTEICSQSGASNCSGLVDLSALTANAKYLISIPIDPTTSAQNGTGYFINDNDFNRITVTAPYAENDASISASN